MGGTILIVEDEADLVVALEYGFQREGYQTVAVSSAQQALALAAAGGIDGVVLDLMLPDLPGTVVCEQLRSHERTSRLPVIMMTARAHAIDVRAGFAAGVDEYVTKPFRMQDLIRRVSAAIRKRAQPTSRGGLPVLGDRMGVRAQGLCEAEV